MQMNDSRIDSGMAIEMMIVEVSERRKIRMTRKLSTAPWRTSCHRLSMAWRMYTDWSSVMPTLTPAGIPISFGTSART